MNLEWTFSAQSYLDQLSPEERGRVLHALEGLAMEDQPATHRLKQLSGADKLYSLRVGADLRVLVRRQGSRVTVVDVVRRSQVEGLRSIVASQQALLG